MPAYLRIRLHHVRLLAALMLGSLLQAAATGAVAACTNGNGFPR